MNDNKKLQSDKRMFPRLFCLFVAVATALSGVIVNSLNGLIYFIGYTVMFFFMNEANQKISDSYYQEEIDKLSKRIENLESKEKGQK